MTVPTWESNPIRRRAADAFRRSVALDSNTAALGHLLEVALLDGRYRVGAASRRALPGPRHQRRAAGLLPLAHRGGAGRRQRLAALRAEYRRMPLLSLWRMMNYAVLDGRRLEDADSAAVAIRAVAGAKLRLAAQQDLPARLRGEPRPSRGGAGRHGRLGRGRNTVRTRRCTSASSTPCMATVTGGAAARRRGSWRGASVRHGRKRRAGGRADRPLRGDPLAAEPRRARRRRPGHRPAPAPRARRLASVAHNQHHLRRAARGEARRGLGRGGRGRRAGPAGCAHPERAGRTTQRPAVAFTLSPAYVRSTIGISPVAFEDFANLDLARLRERQGDLRAALTAVRRRSYSYHLSDYLAPHLREEGRLAALTGDSAGAVRAYRHYLALRSDPEPSVRPSVDSVRQELAKLVGTP